MPNFRLPYEFTMKIKFNEDEAKNTIRNLLKCGFSGVRFASQQFIDNSSNHPLIVVHFNMKI